MTSPDPQLVPNKELVTLVESMSSPLIFIGFGSMETLYRQVIDWKKTVTDINSGKIISYDLMDNLIVWDTRRDSLLLYTALQLFFRPYQINHNMFQIVYPLLVTRQVENKNISAPTDCFVIYCIA